MDLTCPAQHRCWHNRTVYAFAYVQSLYQTQHQSSRVDCCALTQDPFDFWQGANFKLKLKKVAGYWNYDSSEFDRPSPLLDDDDALEALWKKQYSLAALTADDQFKTYEQLQNRLKMVLGQRSAPQRYDEETSNEDNDRGSYTPNFQSRRPEPVSTADFNAPDITPKSTTSEDEDDALSYFQKLAEE